MLSDGDRDLSAVFGLSYQYLTTSQQSLFRRLGLIPGPDIDACAAASLSGADPDTASQLLESLVDHNLLIQQIPGRYRLHDLIRLHARTLAARTLPCVMTPRSAGFSTIMRSPPDAPMP